MRIFESDEIRKANRPIIDGNTLTIFSWVSAVPVDTPNIVVVGCGENLMGPPTDWYIFVDDEGIPVQVYWGDLNDSQRLVIRSSGVKECYIPGEHTDARYYTLEALSGH